MTCPTTFGITRRHVPFWEAPGTWEKYRLSSSLSIATGEAKSEYPPQRNGVPFNEGAIPVGLYPLRKASKMVGFLPCTRGQTHRDSSFVKKGHRFGVRSPGRLALRAYGYTRNVTTDATGLINKIYLTYITSLHFL